MLTPTEVYLRLTNRVNEDSSIDKIPSWSATSATNFQALWKAVQTDQTFIPFMTFAEVSDFYDWCYSTRDQYVGQGGRSKTIQALRALWGGIQMVRADDDVPDLV